MFIVYSYSSIVKVAASCALGYESEHNLGGGGGGSPQK